MSMSQSRPILCAVALRKESVDRNTLAEAWAFLIYVALRKESVDRNLEIAADEFCALGVALRKESVDRNILTITTCTASKKSLSARRAWIEIFRVVP